jgi:predicted metal-dependent phosphoesterase TrpH
VVKSLKLKIDLHCHTSQDLIEDKVGGRTDLISPKELIDLAAEKKYDAISLTHHGIQYRDPEIEIYAMKKGILLIPGVEGYINRKHILMINFPGLRGINSYEDLCKQKSENNLVIAPHPFYKTSHCIGKQLVPNIKCFDAIEHSHLYLSFLNPNKQAIKIARLYNLPVIGNSDTHLKFQFGTTYSIVDVEEKSIEAIIKAIKAGNVEYVTSPLPFRLFVKGILWSLRQFPITIKQLFFRYLEILKN